MAGRFDQEYQKLKERTHRWVVERLDEEGIEVGKATRDALAEFTRNHVGQYISHNRVPLSTQDLNQLVRDILDEVTGFGPLEPLLADTSVNDILVNGPEHVFVEVAGVLQRANTRFINDDHVTRVIRRMLAPLGRRLDEASPMVDARLPDGSRVNAIIPPLALDGPTISIRKFTGNHLSAQQLIENGSMTDACLDVLIRAVESRRNIIISGGTGTGKTTMLNLISQYIPARSGFSPLRIPLSWCLTTPCGASGNTSGQHRRQRPYHRPGAGGELLRMRPDRIILGEVRSAEIIELLQAMNTGHEGSMSTIHANTTRDALVRIETLLAVSGYDASERAIGRLIGSALDIIIQLVRMPDGRRMVSEVVALTPTETDAYHMDYLYRSHES